MGDQVGQNENGSVLPAKNQSEELSKEELNQQLKKQRMLLQKMKQKCDELSKKNTVLENDLARERECFVGKANDDASQDKVKELEAKVASVKDENQLSTRKNKELMEQLECMQMKEETLNSAMVCIQEETNKISIENKSLKSDVATLRAERDQVASLRSTNLQLAEALQESDRKFEQLAEEQSQLKENLMREVKERENVIIMLEDERDKLTALQHEKELLTTDNSVLKSEMDKKIRSVKDLMEEVETLAQKICSLEEAKSELGNKVDDGEGRIEVLVQRIASLESTKVELEHKLENVLVELEEKDVGKQQFVTELQEMKELHNTNAQLQETIDQLKNETESNAETEVAEREHIQQILDQVKIEKQELEQQNKQLIVEKEKLESEMHAKDEVVNLLNVKCETMDEKINSLADINTDLQQILDDSSKHTINLGAIIEETKIEKENLLTELEKMGSLRLERDQLQQALEEHNQNSHVVTEELEVAGSEINKLKQHVELLEADLEFTKVERDRLMFEENREDSDTINFTNSEAESPMSEFERLKKQIELLEAELANAKEERDRLLFQEEKEDTDSTSLQMQIQRLETELEDVKSKLESTEFESEELRANLEDAQQELMKIRSTVHLPETVQLSAEVIDSPVLSAELCTSPLVADKNAEMDLDSDKDASSVPLCVAANESILESGNQRLGKLESEKLILENKLTTLHEQETNLKCIVKEMLVCFSDSENDFSVTDEDQIVVWLQCLKVQLFVLTEKYASLTAKLQEKDSEITTLKNELEDAVRMIDERNETVSELRSSMQTVQETADKCVDEKHCLEEEVRKLNDVHIEQEKHLGEFEIQMQQLRSDLVNKERQVEDCMAVTNDGTNEVKRISDENICLKDELAGLNEQLVKSGYRVQELQGEVEERDSVLEALRLTLTEKESKFSQVFQDYEDKSNQLHALSSELEALRLQEESLKLQLLDMEDLRSKLAHAEADCDQLNKEIEVLHGQLQQEQKAHVTKQAHKSVETEQMENIDTAVQTEDFQLEEVEQLQRAINLERTEHAEQLRTKADIEQNLLTDNERLKMEVSTLQDSVERLSGDADTSSQDFSKLEVAVQESAELVQKYKAVAVKTKKELLDTKQQVTDMEVSLKQMELNKEEAAKLFESNQQALKEAESKCARLQSHLDAGVYDMATVRAKMADLQADKDNMLSELARSSLEIKQLEHARDDLASQVSIIAEGKTKTESLVDKLKGEIHQLQEQMKNVETQLSKEKEAHQSKSAQLDKMQQQMKQKNLMNLEIEDYERLVGELNQQVAELGSQKEKLEDEVKKQGEMAVGLRTQLEQAEAQRQQAEDRGNKLKALLVKAKKDLAEGKRKEAAHQSAQSKNQVELELCKQDAERLKVEHAEILGQNEKAHENMRLMKESQQRIVRSLEAQVLSLQEDIDTLRHEYDTCQAEYEGYKVRVHSVLKQQKNKVTTPSGIHKATQDVESLEKTIEHLRIKLQDASEQLSASLSENQILQDEHDRLLQRHNKLLQEVETKETEWKMKLTTLVSEGNAQEDEHEETIVQLQRQNETVTATFKEQLQTVKAEHERLVESLRLQLAVAEAEISRLQRDQQKMSPTRDDDLFDVTITERQEGEGSENTEPVSSTPNKLHDDYPPSTTLSLEQLLSTDDKTSMTSSIHNDLDGIDVQIGIASKRIGHLSELLNESEASNIRLTEQTRVLKEEIRRLERNQQREQHVSNLEYLKNVVIKFLTLQAGDERERLIPVLTMLLQLSPQERTELGIIAKGASADGGDGSSSGWENYLPRWSGLV